MAFKQNDAIGISAISGAFDSEPGGIITVGISENDSWAAISLTEAELEAVIKGLTAIAAEARMDRARREHAG